MYSLKKYFDDVNLRFINANTSINENDDFIVLFQRDSLQQFIDCYCDYFVYFYENDDCNNIIEIHNIFVKIFSQYKNTKIINCEFIDCMSCDCSLLLIMYENNNVIYVDLFVIDVDDDNNFFIKYDNTYVFMNIFNAMQFLLNYDEFYKNVNYIDVINVSRETL